MLQTDTANEEPDSQPVYQLSRAIHEQGAATEHISFQRIDPRIRMTTTTTTDDPEDDTLGETIPRLTHRPKDLYNLEHRKEMAYLGIPFQAWLEPQTRRGVGKVQIEKAPLFHSGYRVAKMWGEGEVRRLEREGKGKVVKKGEVYFTMKEAGGKSISESGSGSGSNASKSGVWWEWSDQDGRVVAVQVREWDARGEETFKLRVIAPLARRWRDGLVGLWCLWMWHVRMVEVAPKKTWEDRKRIMKMPRLYFSPTIL
ncbi:hypothetical protein B0J18DRAFT_441132 [Chaetomium sp. MPI-SDFR-AT-0129]|nr:hypothetical protein B0J18DRAFT_441132 [Chaetomium sp. MPI-SDFR-AT-0129]